MRAADIAAVDRQARSGFSYLPDRTDRDEWRSRADQVLEGLAWTGDCDDLASTVLDLAGRAGAPLDARFRLLVATPAVALGYDHLVAAIVDDAGRFHLVGDTFGTAYPAEAMAHRPFAYHRLDERDAEDLPLWRDGAPWQTAHGVRDHQPT